MSEQRARQSKGERTRENILDVAQGLLLEHGYGGMSVDQVIAGAGLTKGAFFYHFKSKNDLAMALLQRYVRMDDALLHSLMERSEKLSRDPLQQYLVFCGLLVEALQGLEQPHPGCLIASYTYQLELFDEATRQLVINGFAEWERVLGDKISTAMERHQSKVPVSHMTLVHNLLALFEGGLILGKLYKQPTALAEQVQQHKNYVELLFGLD